MPAGPPIELTSPEAVKAGSGKIYVTNGATQTYLGRDGLLHLRIVNATDTRAIDNFIVRLRRYIEDEPNNPKFVRTVRGIGYKFVNEAPGE